MSLLQGQGRFGDTFPTLRSRLKEFSCTVEKEMETNEQERDGEESGKEGPIIVGQLRNAVSREVLTFRHLK